MAPGSQGGSDWGRYHPVLQQIGGALRRSPASIANKGANLIGTRTNAQRHERELYAALGAGELPFPSLYATVMTAARESGVGPAELPDFLDLLGASDEWRTLFLGEEELSRQDLEKAAAEYIDAAVDERTTKQVLADIRIEQSRFARNVLAEFDHRCGSAASMVGRWQAIG